MLARKLEKRKREGKAQKKSGSPAGPGGRLTSFVGGLDVLVSGLGARLEPMIRLNHGVAKVRRDDDGWIVICADGTEVRTRRLVLASPTLAAADALREFDYDLASALDAIPYAPIIVVATGHRREDIAHDLAGFGFLVPRSQKMRALGSIWTSSIFAKRAPEGHVQIRTMFGGAGDPGVLSLSNDELWETIRRELDPLLGIKADPVFTRIYRWPHGIPQYTLGHRERRARIEQLATRHPGLYFVGNAFYGVGLNDCVKLAHRIAAQIASSA
jgi:oxygen-dependent protoporphyrinogen oxidase